MTHLSLRQWLIAHNLDASPAERMHLARCVKRYSEQQHFAIEVRKPFGAHVEGNLYDIRALDAVCGDFRQSPSEHHCGLCFKMRPHAAFGKKGKGLFPYCKACMKARYAQFVRTEDGFKTHRGYKRRRFAEIIGSVRE